MRDQGNLFPRCHLNLFVLHDSSPLLRRPDCTGAAASSSRLRPLQSPTRKSRNGNSCPETVPPTSSSAACARLGYQQIVATALGGQPVKPRSGTALKQDTEMGGEMIDSEAFHEFKQALTFLHGHYPEKALPHIRRAVEKAFLTRTSA